MDDQRALDQLSRLVQKGETIAPRPANQQWQFGGGLRLKLKLFAEWRSQTLVFIRSLLGSSHAYLVEFERLTEPKVVNDQRDPQADQRDAGLGVLAAIHEDVGSGYLTELRVLEAAEVFVDFLGMAEHLLQHGYHHAAASLAGAVLEDGLRRRLSAVGARATGNLESMNQIALDQDVYGALVFKQVKVWIDIRNDADHANWSAVEPDRVAGMIRDLPGFRSRDLGMQQPR